MGERNANCALTLVNGNEDIRFVEDDESSSEKQPPKAKVSVAMRPQAATIVEAPQNPNEQDGSYAEIASPKTLSPLMSRLTTNKSKEKIRAEPVQKTRRKSDLVLNIFSRTPSLKKNRQEYERVSAREDSTYSNILETPSLLKASSYEARGESYGLRSFGGCDIKRFEIKGEDEEQILEVLRQVVRKCTNPDPMKRPSSTDVLDLVGDSPETS